jgi:hypothetical protein
MLLDCGGSAVAGRCRDLGLSPDFHCGLIALLRGTIELRNEVAERLRAANAIEFFAILPAHFPRILGATKLELCSFFLALELLENVPPGDACVDDGDLAAQGCQFAAPFPQGLLELGAFLGAKRGNGRETLLQGLESVAFSLRSLERSGRKTAVELRPGHPLEKLGAFVGVGAEERGEVTLGEEHRSTELIERETELLLDDLSHASAKVGDDLTSLHVAKFHSLKLKSSLKVQMRTPNFPTGSIAPRVPTDEVDLGVSRRRTLAKDMTDIAVTQPVRLILAADQRSAPAG